ncbi:hypothetical protein XENORESO_012196 [Xenotaenia resolanae]|uniref:Uncharacterized protein n=1 Tax=Xenotaenia resolanae TaxID=208358 RepID=A0ABV0VYV2_9TELE
MSKKLSPDTPFLCIEEVLPFSWCMGVHPEKDQHSLPLSFHCYCAGGCVSPLYEENTDNHLVTGRRSKVDNDSSYLSKYISSGSLSVARMQPLASEGITDLLLLNLSKPYPPAWSVLTGTVEDGQLNSWVVLP